VTKNNIFAKQFYQKNKVVFKELLVKLCVVRCVLCVVRTGCTLYFVSCG